MQRQASSRSAIVSIVVLAACAAPPPASKSANAQPPPEQQAALPQESAPAEAKKDSDLTPELAAMIEPGTCNSTLLRDTHFREFKDSKGKPHRAFLIGAGEKLCLVADPEEGLPALELSSDPVPLTSAKEHLISIEFKILDLGSVLVVKNHYSKTLKFRGAMALPNQLDLVGTSVCPVMPGRFSLEHWPDSANSLLLTDFTLHDPSEHLACE